MPGRGRRLLGGNQGQRGGGRGGGGGGGRGQSQGGKPAWESEVDLDGGNAAVVQLVTQQTVAEEDAGSLLSQAGDTQAAEATGAAGGGGGGEGQAEAPAKDTNAKKPEGKLGDVYEEHEKRAPDLHIQLGSRGPDLEAFVANWEKNKARYEKVSAETGVPAKLVAALHWRESTGDFGTYLHQGDPIGKKSVNEPKGILFDNWHDAAVDAIQQKQGIIDSTNMTAETTDLESIATFAEAYNGLGYHNADRVSPYVYAGTDAYSRGKYVSDGKFSSSHVDQQLGVLAMMDSIGGLDQELAEVTPDEAWKQVVDGKKILRQGDTGPAVEKLQEKLGLDADGDFGSGTRKSVEAFQRKNGLDPDGEVGKGTAAKLG